MEAMLTAPLAAMLGLAVSAPTSRHPVRLLPGPALQDFSLANTSPRFAARGFTASRIDTLEVHVLLVQFKKETPDVATTTGDGTFGSDKKFTYALEPAENRLKQPLQHFRNIFEFQKNYWSDVSHGRIVLEFRMFPTGDSAFYTLDRPMGWYSPAQKGEGETQKSFDSTRTSRLLEFVSDAARKGAKDANGPFATAPTASPTRHRAYLLLHAGANPFADGGRSGASNANTPSDISDFYVEDSSFQYLRDRARVVDTTHLKDSFGIVLHKPGADTLKKVLMLSETASQDGLNWGIHGLLANQIGRFIGLPDTYDWVRGYNMMGRWCGMDFGGYLLNGSGFLPVRPSAWLRLYMGWATPVVATPSGARKFRLPPVGPTSDSVLVIPLDDGEYLLVENRQKADADGKVRLRVGALDGSPSTVEVDADSVEHLFLDSLNGKPNPRRLKGYVLGAGADAGIPTSGLVTWRVDEWLLRSSLAYGGPNVWLGESMRDRYRGITLVEADGIPTLGVAFTNAASQTSFDYGSGSDLLPHAQKTSSGRDTVTAIGPLAYASTKNLADGRSLVTMRSAWPSGAHAEASASAPSGDSVWTPGGDVSLPLTLDWGPYRDTLANFPVRLPPSWDGLSLLPGPVAGSFWNIDTSGRPQLFHFDASPAFAGSDTLLVPRAFDSVRTNVPSRYSKDSLELPVQVVGAPFGRPLGTALLGDTLVVRTATALHQRWLVDGVPSHGGDSARTATESHPGRFVAGPVAISGRAWVADADSLFGFAPGKPAHAIAIPFAPHGLAEFHLGDHPGIALVGDSARLAFADIVTDSVRKTAISLDPVPGETFHVAVADFDRDGADDAFALGSRGSALVAGPSGIRSGWPRRFDRGQDGAPETSAPALGDIDGDGHPEAVFTGNDRVYAVGGTGIPLAKWPVRISRTEPVGLATASRRWPAGFIGSSPLLCDLDGDGTSEVLVGLPDARIAALSASGAFFEGALEGGTSGTGKSPSYGQSRWPLAAGGRVGDSTRSPVLHIALVAAHGSEPPRLLSVSSLSTVDGFRLAGAKPSWSWPGADARRSARLADSLLGAVPDGAKAVSAFHIFPSPVRNKAGTFRWDLGRDARRVTLTVFDQTGFAVLSRTDLPTGRGPRDLPLSGLMWGTGVYAARLEVEWAEGGSSESWTRFGVLR